MINKMAKTNFVRKNAYMHLLDARDIKRQVKTLRGDPKEGSFVILQFIFTSNCKKIYIESISHTTRTVFQNF